MANLRLSRVALAVTLAACGGNVVVDSSSSGTVAPGAGGAGAAVSNGGFTGNGGFPLTGNGGFTGNGASGSACGVTLVGANLCSGSGSTGAGGPTVCMLDFCAPGLTGMWTATCTGSSCQCEEPGGVRCSCSFSDGTDACATQTQCCFTIE